MSALASNGLDPQRVALLIGGNAKQASQATGVSDRFLRFSASDLHNPLLAPRDRARHTRFSALAHGLAGACLRDLEGVPAPHTGVVTASVYGAAEQTNATRQAYREGDVDPVQFSKATHSHLGSMLAMAWGLHGPVSSLVGRRGAALEALWLASAFIEARVADAMLVVLYDEIGDCARRHLSASAPARARFGEACAVLCLASARCLPQCQGWSVSRVSESSAEVGPDVPTIDGRTGVVDYLGANVALALLDWIGGPAAPMLDLVSRGRGPSQRLRLRRREAAA